MHFFALFTPAGRHLRPAAVMWETFSTLQAILLIDGTRWGVDLGTGLFSRFEQPCMHVHSSFGAHLCVQEVACIPAKGLLKFSPLQAEQSSRKEPLHAVACRDEAKLGRAHSVVAVDRMSI